MRCGVERRIAVSIRIDDGLIKWHEDEFMAGKCGRNAVSVGGIQYPVRNHDDLAAPPLACQPQRSLPDIYRSGRGLDHNNDYINGLGLEAGQGADACFEVGDDDGATELGGAEQLLGRETTSRSTRFGVFDSADHGQTHAVGGIAAETVDELIPARRMTGALIVENLTNGCESFGLIVADPE